MTTDVSERPGWFRYRRRVKWAEVDPSANYRFTAALGYVEEAEIALFRAAGLLEELYPRLPRTFVEARFRAPARFGDELVVDVRPRRLGHSSIELQFQLCRDQTRCAEGTIGAAFINDEGTAIALPEAVRAGIKERFASVQARR